MMNRREMLRRSAGAAAALGFGRLVGGLPLGWTAPADKKEKKKLLVFTRSHTYQHDVVKRGAKGELSLAEKILTDMGEKNGFEVTCSKDGRTFIPEEIKKFDAFFFQTQGDLLSEKSEDGQPPMTADGKKVFLDAIASGKGFVGAHCASDTFHSKGEKGKTQEPKERDPYIAMVGGEFITHGEQQKAWMRVTDTAFPGAKDVKDFELKEEWYALKNFADNLHVILVQDGKDMKELYYQRPVFPATWARTHEKGRVFYSSMGHRDDVWQNKLFQELILGGLSWAFGNVDAKIEPNIKEVAPKADDIAGKK
jgi:type 1 glutamine amidotransferase